MVFIYSFLNRSFFKKSLLFLQLKVAEDFKCQKVTFVGDKGMIKSKQIEDLEKEDFHYITSIAKEQIKSDHLVLEKTLF